MTHAEFLRQVALQLVYNPSGSQRKRPCDDDITLLPPKTPRMNDHDWKQYPKKRECKHCKESKTRRPSRAQRPLGELDQNIKRQPYRSKPVASQSTWGCQASECEGLRACKKSLGGSCWIGMSRHHRVE